MPQPFNRVDDDGTVVSGTIMSAQCECGPGRVNPPESSYVCRQALAASTLPRIRARRQRIAQW